MKGTRGILSTGSGSVFLFRGKLFYAELLVIPIARTVFDFKFIVDTLHLVASSF